MADAFVGEIRAFGFDFVPNGWLPCNGATYPIQQFSALFSLIGIQYGGNGTTSFMVPDLRGVAAAGVNPGNTAFAQTGTKGGSEKVALDTTTMPMHNHMLQAVTRTAAAQTSVATATPATNTYLTNAFSTGLNQGIIAYSNTGGATTLNPQTLGQAGSNVPHNNMSPYLTMTYCICVSGVFPARP